MDVSWTIRSAARRDVAATAALERRCFSDPWSEAAISETFAAPGMLNLVAERGEGVQGYVIARAIAGESEILNLAVAPEVRGQGLGGRLLDAMLARLRQTAVREVFLEVRQGNAAARGLYRSRRFEEVGRRGRYYRHPVEDAIVLRLELECLA
jgi:ribosomal-protein-alanine N-acetyltransferase